MELFASVWIVFVLYCTEWLGIRQCFAVPVPTLTNYHNGYYSKNSWNYRQTSYPEKYEKFVFPSKQQEPMPILAERSGGFGGGSSGKIFFPDEIPPPSKDKQYQFTDSEVLPVWKTHHRPSTAISSSSNKWPSLDEVKRMQSSEDGSIRMELPTTQEQQLSNGNIMTKLETTDDDSSSVKTTLQSHSPSSNKKTTQEERVQEAVQEFYKWLKSSRARQKNQQKATTKCPDQFLTGSSSMTGTSEAANINHDSSKPGTFISDQSLVAGLKDQKCPEGQIRLENGECRVKLAI